MNSSQAAASKAVFSRFRDAVNAGDPKVIEQAIGEAFAPDVLFHVPAPAGATGARAPREVRAVLLRAFPDVHVAIEDLIAEGDKVVAGNTVTGTHQGEYRGVPPAGKTVRCNEFLIARLAGGQFAETWGVADVYAQLRRLGMTREGDGK